MRKVWCGRGWIDQNCSEVQKAQGENEVRSRGLIWKESDDGMDECVGGFM